MGFKKLPNGNYIYTFIGGNNIGFIKSINNSTSGYFSHNVNVPKELIGKRCRLILEVID